jgi:hypothetical protein
MIPCAAVLRQVKVGLNLNLFGLYYRLQVM